MLSVPNFGQVQQSPKLFPINTQDIAASLSLFPHHSVRMLAALHRLHYTALTNAGTHLFWVFLQACEPQFHEEIRAHGRHLRDMWHLFRAPKHAPALGVVRYVPRLFRSREEVFGRVATLIGGGDACDPAILQWVDAAGMRAPECDPALDWYRRATRNVSFVLPKGTTASGEGE